MSSNRQQPRKIRMWKNVFFITVTDTGQIVDTIIFDYIMFIRSYMLYMLIIMPRHFTELRSNFESLVTTYWRDIRHHLFSVYVEVYAVFGFAYNWGNNLTAASYNKVDSIDTAYTHNEHCKPGTFQRSRIWSNSGNGWTTVSLSDAGNKVSQYNSWWSTREDNQRCTSTALQPG